MNDFAALGVAATVPTKQSLVRDAGMRSFGMSKGQAGETKAQVKADLRTRKSLVRTISKWGDRRDKVNARELWQNRPEEAHRSIQIASG
jgi:hypothetical protein